MASSPHVLPRNRLAECVEIKTNDVASPQPIADVVKPDHVVVEPSRPPLASFSSFSRKTWTMTVECCLRLLSLKKDELPTSMLLDDVINTSSQAKNCPDCPPLFSFNDVVANLERFKSRLDVIPSRADDDVDDDLQKLIRENYRRIPFALLMARRPVDPLLCLCVASSKTFFLFTSNQASIFVLDSLVSILNQVDVFWPGSNNESSDGSDEATSVKVADKATEILVVVRSPSCDDANLAPLMADNRSETITQQQQNQQKPKQNPAPSIAPSIDDPVAAELERLRAENAALKAQLATSQTVKPKPTPPPTVQKLAFFDASNFQRPPTRQKTLSSWQPPQLPPSQPQPGRKQQPSPTSVVPVEEAREVVAVLFFCRICLEENSMENVCILTNCRHKICRAYAKTYAKTLVKQRGPLVCPIDDCRAELNFADAELTLEPNDIGALRQFLFEQVTSEMGFFKCPRPSCAGLVELMAPRQKFTCPACRFETCTDCRKPFHFGLSCEANAEWLGERGLLARAEGAMSSAEYDRRFAEYVNQRNLQTCPKCGRVVEKSEGCNHMQCRCGTHFCYLCGEKVVIRDKMVIHECPQPVDF